MKRLIQILFILSGLLAVTTAGAQRIKATASLDSANILIGDQIRLILEIDYPPQVAVIFPQVPKLIAEKIEVLHAVGGDTLQEEGASTKKQIASWLITSFDSGSYRIPPFWFKITIDGHTDSIPTNGLTLHVHTLPVDTNRGPTDIKMPYGAPVTLKEVIPYILGAILLGAIIFFIFYALRRRRNHQPIFSLPVKPKEPPHVIALRELDQIKGAKLWQQGKTKHYYSEVTDTLRRYIEGRFDIPAMEQTTAEILQSFRYRRDLIPGKSFGHLEQILSLADLVKFAKYEPLPDDNSMVLFNSYLFVNDTRPEDRTPEAPKEIEKDDEEDVEIK